MKKALSLLFLLLPCIVGAQEAQEIDVRDGSIWADDIDWQSDTSTYWANWEADPSIWDSYWGGWLKQYRYELFEDGRLLFMTYVPEELKQAGEPFFSSTAEIRYPEELAEPLKPGSTYHLRVTAIARPEADPDLMEEAGDGSSDGVTIEGGEEPPEEEPPEEEPIVVRPRGGTVSLSARPSSLRFASDESAASITLSVAAGGTGTVVLTSIREDRTYPGWGEETGGAERLDLTVAGGFTETIRRTVSLSALDRAKALGSGTKGSFTVTYVVRGRDTWGNPVSASLDVPVEVSGGSKSALNVQGVSVELPASPYFLGESVVGSQITVEASGSGTVTGQVTVDDSPDWSDEPAFAVSIVGTTTFPIPGALPVEEPGLHTVRVVELTSPEELSCQSVYEVSAAEAPFPPQTLTLVPGVAELADFDAGEATVTDDGDGGLVYTVNASASLRLLSLDGQVVPRAAVNGLEVHYPGGDPQAAEVLAGTVVVEGGDEVLASFADGYLELNRIAFDRADDPPQLTARATVTIPQLGAGVAIIEGVGIGEAGVEVDSYPWDQAVPLAFEAFGFEFGLDGVEGHEADARYAFVLSGGVRWRQSTGGAVEEQEILAFDGLTFFSDGAMEGALGVSQPFELIPGVLTVTEAGLALEDDELSFALGGTLGGLPEPLDVMETAFSLVFDTGGNVESGIVLVDELTTGERGKGGDDETEWGDEFPIATLDVTYLAIDLVVSGGILHRDHSRVCVGVDVYLDLLSGDDAASDRIGFGAISGENEFTNGLEISFAGDVSWPAPDAQVNLVSGKSLDYGPVTATLDNLALRFDDGLSFLFSGTFGLGIEQIEGSISFTDLEVSLSGVEGAPTIAQTQLGIMDFVSVSVGEVAWGSGEIAFYEDQTAGEGVNRTPARSEEPVTITVDNYFRIDGAEINIGSGDSSLFSGGFGQLLYYTADGDDTFILSEVNVEVSGCELYADIKYDRTYLRVAGGVTMQQIEAKAVGKIGTIPDTAADGTPEPRAGEPTFGLFVLVGGLGIPVAPSVFLDEVGGGVFINPTDEDIDTVLALAEFDRPELDAEIASMRPAGAGDPGGFSVMLLGGVYVAERTLVQGRAFLTLTANYFSLDADVKALEGMLHGRSYFLISWSPWFAEGNNVLEANLFDIFTIEGELAFYAYRSDAWGIVGEAQVSVFGKGVSSGGCFIGPPGFMVEASVKSGVDIGLVSGHITFDGMVWYYNVPDPPTWGAWAAVTVDGSLLWGLVSAEAGIEGALIGEGTQNVLVYAVGHARLKACWIEVFEGSIWVTIGSGGFDGGEGRKKRYDALIDDARNMSATMEEAKEDLQDALDEAKLSLYQLDEAQRNAAGLALVERSGFSGEVARYAFEASETENWEGGLPNELETMYDLVFGPDAQAIVDLRTELEELHRDINDGVAELEELQDAVLDRIDAYEAILLEELPGIQDLSSPGNPFAGMQEETVSVGQTTRTVRVGFEINQAQAVQQTEEYETLREGFANYQDEFIKRAGLLDSRLRELDEVLFESEEALAVLMQRYAAIYADMVRYTNEFVDYQRDNADQARANLRESAAMSIPDDLAGNFPAGASAWSSEAVIHQRMLATVDDLSAAELDRWNDLRITLINFFLDIQGAEDDWDTTTDGEIEMDPVMMFVQSGLELWWRIPTRGWTQSIELADERTGAALASFHENGDAFTTSWAAATGLSDEVFDRKADLYAILFEVYDQLSVYGSGMIAVDALGNAVGKPTIGPLRPPPRATEIPTVSEGSWMLVTTYFERQRTEVTPYLEIPSVTEVSGTLTSDDEHTALFSGSYDATHPVAVVEYVCRARQGGAYPPWLSVGTAQVFADLFLRDYTVERNHYFEVRARGAGGLTIEQSSGFDLEFFDPETDAEPFVSTVDTSDDSPPSQPWVGLAETATANPEELYAQWRASDSQSGIQRYEYAVGTWSAGGDEAPPTDVVPWTPAGGRTEAIIKELALEHGHRYVVSVRATNGAGLRSTGSSQPVLVDLTPPQGIEITRFVRETADGYPNSVRFAFEFGEEPETELAAHFFALGTTPETGDLFPWTEALIDFGRIADIPVDAGTPIYLLVKGTNALGLESVVTAELAFDFPDDTPPPAPMVVTDPQQSTTDTFSLAMGWNEVTDDESGVVGYEYAISSTPLDDPEAEPDIVSWVPVERAAQPYYIGKQVGGTGTIAGVGDDDGRGDAAGDDDGAVFGFEPVGIGIIDGGLGTDYSVERDNLSLSGAVYAVVRVTNGAGLSAVGSSPPVLFGLLPAEPRRTDEGGER